MDDVALQPSRDEIRNACERFGIRMIVLFGSRSKAPGGLAAGPESDLDLAFAFRSGTKRASFGTLYHALSEAFPGHDLDLVFLDDADPLFRWEIMDRGELLYGDIDEFLELRAFAYRDFVDSADLRALEWTLTEKKMARVRERIDAAP